MTRAPFFRDDAVVLRHVSASRSTSKKLVFSCHSPLEAILPAAG